MIAEQRIKQVGTVQDLMISSQRDWPLEHEAGRKCCE